MPALFVPSHYRAPSQDGGTLVLPDKDAVGLVAENLRLRAGWDVELCGRRLDVWQRRAREEMLAAAGHYSRVYRNVDLPGTFTDPETPVVMAGHQPTLFHSGVWFKNFLIDELRNDISAARAAAPAVAVNLVIDNDVCSASSIRVPHFDPATRRLSRATVAYDAAGGGVPYEQNRIRDRREFENFAQRVCRTLGPLVKDPLVSELWEHAVTASRRCESVSCSLAQARHALEGELGLQTLELPLSVLCRGEPFAAFALAVFSDIGRFREIYNDSLAAYRSVYKIRSSAHPAPALKREGEWIEAPFWIYSDESPQRRTAWVRVGAGGLELSDRRRTTVRIAGRLDCPEAAEQLASHAGPHFKLRPRALITTMFARMLLSDLFVHGIGGAKYDELGDAIARRFFAIEPCRMMVATATMLLPIRASGMGDAAPADSEVELRQKIRRTYFAPETFAAEVPLPPSLCREKSELLANIPPRGRRRQWHDSLTRINETLSAPLEPLRERLRGQLAAAWQHDNDAAILSSREHPFCLFPLEHLVSRFRRSLVAEAVHGADA